TPDLHEVLPPDYETVRVGVVYVTPRGELEALSFGFERLLLEMVKTRRAATASTSGKNRSGPISAPNSTPPTSTSTTSPAPTPNASSPPSPTPASSATPTAPPNNSSGA